MRSNGRIRAALFVAASVAVSALGLVLAFFFVTLRPRFSLTPRVHWHELVAVFAEVSPAWLGAFTVLNVTTLLARTFQTQALVRRRDGAAPRWYACWQAVTLGMMAQNVLPARLSEAVRVVALARADDVRAATVTGALVLGRVLDLIALLVTTCVPTLFLAAALALSSDAVAAVRGFAIAGAALASALIVLLVWFFRRRARAIAWAGGARPWLGRLVAGFAEGLSALGAPRRLVEAVLSTLAIPLLLMATYGAALYACRLGALPAGTTVVLVAAVLVAIAIPSAPSSVGVYHAAATLTLRAVGAAPAQAAAFALLTHAIGAVTFITLGAIALVELGGRRLFSPERARPER